MGDNNSQSKSGGLLVIPTVLLALLALVDIISGIAYIAGFGVSSNILVGVFVIIVGIVALYACMNCHKRINYKPTLIVCIIVTILSIVDIIGLIIGIIVIYIVYSRKSAFTS